MRVARVLPTNARLLIVVPNWVGDVVLATPVLGALREHFCAGRITLLLRSYVREVLAGGEWCDEVLTWPDRSRLATLVRDLRARRFDAAVLLTNSFASAWVTARAGIPTRVGYARDGRGWLLTERLHPPRAGGRWLPAPMPAYYAALAARVGCRVTDGALRLGVTAEEDAAAAALRVRWGLGPGARYAVINPGAAFGAAKCWLPERFAEVCVALAERWGLTPLLSGAPGETPLLERIAALGRHPAIRLGAPGITLGSLKPLIRDAELLVCNDTGPRHFGLAFGVPTVTIFGPTERRWTDTGAAGEIQLQASVECGPCQLRRCPLDHRCMRALGVREVLAAIERLRPAPRVAELRAGFRAECA